MKAFDKIDDVTKAMMIIYMLALCKNLKANDLPKHIIWQLNAYTNWNLILIVCRYLYSLDSLDPFLFVNSLGILTAFKTGFCQGLDQNIRKKLISLGFPMTKTQFKIGDFIVHTLPVALTYYILVKKKKRIAPINVTYAITLATWFAFRQAGILDASSVYVPHPWKRSWIAGVTAMMLSPILVDASIDGKRTKLIGSLFCMSIPYFCTRMDKTVYDKYNLEFMIQKIKLKNQADVPKTQSLPDFFSEMTFQKL
jgi:hypothetical protein